jgi:Integrase zinc binding domain
LKHIQDLKKGSSKFIRYSILLQNYNFTIEHIPGTKNTVADALSRIDHAPEEPSNTNSEFEIDPLGHLAALQVDELVNDMSAPRDPMRRKRRKLLALHLLPIDDTQPSRRSARLLRKQQSRNETTETSTDSPSLSRIEPGNNSTSTTLGADDQDLDIFDEESHAAITQLQQSIIPQINLQSQAECPIFAAMIKYLQEQILPSDKQLVQRILSQTEDFFIQNEQLFHLARIRSKRLSQIMPRFIQLCIPPSARLAIISAFHDQTHAGFLKSYLTLKTRYFWVGSATDVRLYVSSCTTCQQIKPQVNKPRLPLTSLPVQDLFECIHVDHHTMNVISGCKHPYQHILIIRDSYSPYFEAVPVKTQSAEETSKALFDSWFPRYGLCRVLISDRGQAFMSKLFNSLLALGHSTLSPSIKHICRTSYRPQTNSVAELANKTLIRHLRAYCSNQADWPDYITSLSYAERSTVNLSTKVSPFFAMYRKDMLIPCDLETIVYNPSEKQRLASQFFAKELELMRTIVKQTYHDAKLSTEKRFNSTAKPHDFVEGQRVFLEVDHVPPGTS